MSNFQAPNIFVQKQVYSFIALLKEKRMLFFLSATAIVLITLFLYEAEPYNISLWEDQYKILKLSGYGFIYTSSICLCLLFIPQHIIYPVILNRSSVSILVSVQIILVLCIGVINWLYTAYIYDEYPVNTSSLFKSIKHTFSFSLLSFISYVAHLLWRDKSNKSKLEVMNQVACDRKIDSDESNTLKLEEIITFDKIDVIVTDVMLIKADGNYIYLYYLFEDALRKKHLRYKISDTEKQLSAYNQFVRVRKSYLVNMAYISREELVANLTTLKIKGIDEHITIGRTFKRNLKKWLSVHADMPLESEPKVIIREN
jgi:hypothetical protein